MEEARAAGARLGAITEHTGLCLRTYQRWCDEAQALGDKRQLHTPCPVNKLSETERESILSVSNDAA